MIITILVGIIGMIIALYFKVPAGAMIGALASVGIYNIFTDAAFLPSNFKILTQIATGIFIGAKISKKDILGLKTVFIPGIIVVIVMGIFNFFMGYFITKTTQIDIVTALFATAPGGITDMSIIAYDFGAEASIVALLQLIRLISVVTLIPIIIKTLTQNKKKEIQKKEFISKKNYQNKRFSEIIITLLLGSIGGFIGISLKIPSGAMTGAMIASALYNIFSNKAYMPLKLRQIIQMFAGTMIGSKITSSDIQNLDTMIIPVFIVIIGFCLLNIILGFIILKITNFSVETSFFAASPGGMSDMSIIASEMGADTPKVAIIQFLRLVSVVALYPILIKLLNEYIF